ncbi:MAG: type III secretion system chaperone [Chlamydiae bacterium]|nr:type III secretion system chaperone [Chlamydiota bacterium]
MEKLLKKLSDDLKIEVKHQEKDKSYLININPEARVKLWKKEKKIFLKSDLILCPMQKREMLFIELMKANLLGKITGECAIGLDQDEKYLTLSMTLPYEINYSLFKERLEDFVNYLIYWKSEIIMMKKKLEESIY